MEFEASPRNAGLITIHRISTEIFSPSSTFPCRERTAKIKVRLSSQYCERGTNEIRAASGRISSFELARNSSRLYLSETRGMTNDQPAKGKNESLERMGPNRERELLKVSCFSLSRDLLLV